MKRTPQNAELWECQAVTNALHGKEPVKDVVRRHYVKFRKKISERLRGVAKEQTSRPVSTTPRPVHLAESRFGGPTLQEGDRVVVRSFQEISGMLDERGLTKGCKFLEQMSQYCGQEYLVVRRIDRFYDELTARLCKAKGIVLLDQVYCDGTQVGGCDRMCLLFWRTEWLRKLD